MSGIYSCDTIFALATPPARSGVAVVRISGQGARAALEKLTRKSGWKPNTARYCSFSSPSTINHQPSIIDQGLALFFAAPKSFTGEDTAEIHCHGSLAVIRELLAALGSMEGLRPAEAGEFTRRAFLNGKMDLIEAEGLADLIDAETSEQKTQALRQMEGELSRRYEELRAQILRPLALLEAYIDFPEEEIPESVLAETKAGIASLIEKLDHILREEGKGERVREGIHIVILGAPNAGKSSLLNALARRDAAIVSDIAGTTRDVIEVRMDMAGLPVILTDTAGLRESADRIEEEGVRRALGRARQADLKLVMFDASQPPDAQTQAQIDDNALIILNKIDLLSSPIRGEAGKGALRTQSEQDCPHPNPPRMGERIPISTRTGAGLDRLLEAVQTRISALFPGNHAPLITRARHRALLAACKTHLERVDFTQPLEITCEELRLAAHALGKITGKITVDDVLDVIFKQFCIGK